VSREWNTNGGVDSRTTRERNAGVTDAQDLRSCDHLSFLVPNSDLTMTTHDDRTIDHFPNGGGAMRPHRARENRMKRKKEKEKEKE